ncbi:MerR family transcriptional regulator [Aggregatibacter actinomycetemcomitans]|uniref:chaperone modulator CbpM n=1 Tax=Aggregatibacter actinomycetemcomitans TaxID=714 RepID=UPI00022AD607|nr:chaperone modulator CbpM [Aggregatibacter actinomycetemcomitans]KYK96974.1 MerR family transcriptional regulator [Aggregatibacter actinomycetemcomitans serotype d str. SA3733]ANU83049.1 MerR family transcriptional regulator [Aggregatibacter actinomycetemcomitans]KOE66091.1 MerR family transcriptional regulator [Aggregatibacter actinomycetemcomitans serotype d str. I63B]KYK83155.1 MerR family transcriptional regulator [Aggregatibacter actinomycetemcomitans serotype d str. SA3033]KYK85726.1 M
MKQNIDIKLSFSEMLNVCAGKRQWLLALIDEGIISVEGQPEQAIFSGFQMARVRRAHRLSHDFEASVPALSLIMQLLDEVEELRKQTRSISLLSDH